MINLFFIFSIFLEGQVFFNDTIPLTGYPVKIVELDTVLMPFDSFTVKTDKKGKFEFKNKKEKGIYIVKTIYKGITYRTDPIIGDNSSIKLSVYDTTSDASHLFIEKAHIAFLPFDEMFEVAEVYTFLNARNKTIKKILKISLPVNYSHLLSPGGILPFEMKVKDNYLIYDKGFPPGRKTISILYHIPKLPENKIEKIFDSPLNEFMIMIPENLDIKGLKNFEVSTQGTPQGNFKVYSLKKIKPGEKLNFYIVSLKGKINWGEFVAPFFILVLFILFIIFVRKKWEKKKVI